MEKNKKQSIPILTVSDFIDSLPPVLLRQNRGFLTVYGTTGGTLSIEKTLRQPDKSASVISIIMLSHNF